MLDDYQKRKQKRKEKYKNELGKKKKTCGACNGSGYYDVTGSPPCAACDGTGKE